ncbi:SDR family oxidoreductase [Flavobacterium sp. KACC 22761]|uniref:SDR family oxidoreductase n=1 Tax=Flavobacterium sp. KACC 22761 TaxID=3092665 RepID=UPI002A75F9C7|nr:NAD(P)H-binding protein [Flavobacterium sp. KACC 22761]WPO77872.1 NAD(P)H-binding protein [Flavobacterium sp. KACC 22761]
MNKILITGGNGHLGKYIVDSLLSKGYNPSVLTTQTILSESNRVQFFTGDLVENKGLQEATEGADVIIHCASNPRNFQQTDIKGTKNLLEAIDKNATKHFIYISIVGIDKSDYPYYGAKLEVEKSIINSGIPFTILRTTQFHDFVFNLLKTLEEQNSGNEGFIEIPSGLKFQSIAVNEVADLLISLALEKPKGLLEDCGGPEVFSFEEMVASYLKINRKNRQIKLLESEDIRHKLFTTGINLCPNQKLGKQTWEEFLIQKA